MEEESVAVVVVEEECLVGDARIYWEAAVCRTWEKEGLLALAETKCCHGGSNS